MVLVTSLKPLRLSLRCEWWPSPGVLCFQSTVKLEVGEQSSKPEASKSEKNELQCDICRKSLKTKKSLAQHMRLVHDVTPTRVKRGGNKKGERGDFPCEECGNHFKTMNGLKVHMGTIHKERRGRRGKGPFKCELCDSRFSQRANIRMHMIHIHRIVPPAERNNTLERKITGGSAPKELSTKFMCSECGRCLTKWAQLQDHLVLVHGWSFEKANEVHPNE